MYQGSHFHGTHKNTIDAKGRMFVPAALRKQLEESKDGDGKVEFYVTISGEDCLMIYSKSMWDKALMRLSEMSQEEQTELRPLFAKASRCIPDEQGRIALTQELRDFAQLKKNVTLVGIGLYIQIWDSEIRKLKDEKESTKENMQSVIRKLKF